MRRVKKQPQTRQRKNRSYLVAIPERALALYLVHASSLRQAEAAAREGKAELRERLPEGKPFTKRIA